MMPAKRSGRRILVTGGAGFIGSHLVEGLLDRGDYVRVLDNFSTGKMKNLEHLNNLPHLEIIFGDIRDYQVVKNAAEGIDAILHQAALGSVPRSIADPITTQQVNADGTLNVFLAAKEKKVPRVVYASSSSVYGDSTNLPKLEGQEGRPLSPYALTKKNNEEYGKLFKELYGLDTIGLRYFNVYGPRQDPESEYAAVIPRFVTALLRGKQPVIYGTGNQSRDFTYVKDVVRANLLALEAPSKAWGMAYNIGRGGGSTISQLLEMLQDLLKTSIPPRYDPPRPGDVMHSTADISLAREMLGFSPSYDLSSGLGESIEWFQSNLTTG